MVPPSSVYDATFRIQGRMHHTSVSRHAGTGDKVCEDNLCQIADKSLSLVLPRNFGAAREAIIRHFEICGHPGNCHNCIIVDAMPQKHSTANNTSNSSHSTPSRHPSSKSLDFDRGNRVSSMDSVLTASYSNVYGVDRSLRVLVDDNELWQRALVSKGRIDFRELMNLSVCQWKWKDSNNKFTIFRRQVESVDPAQKLPNTAHEVLAAERFYYGSNVHTVSGKGYLDNPDDEQLTVKTAAFVRSNMLARNEQWCFLEHFKRNETQDGFAITINSMPSTELRVGKADSDRVDEIHDTIAGYLVEKVPNESIMRVLFCAQYGGSDGAVKGKARAKRMKSRLTFLARGVTRLPDVVPRRRLGAPTSQLSVSSNVAEPHDSKCIL
ncbi:hypothetical protein FI667_g12311, partial [Globisporangium splendens]